MPGSKSKLSLDDIGTLLFIAALIFGAWFRIFVPYSAGFPINDGGLFHKMIEGIQTDHYRLSETIQYNGLNLPLAYPPFGFYFAGIVTDLFDLTLFDTLQWLPALFLIAIIPVVFYLSHLLLKSRFEAGLASLLYALTPGSITWLIMGGGITRSLGQLFLLLAISNIFLLFTQQQKKHLILAIIFSSLVCITHPEATIHTIGIALLFWFFYGKTKKGSIDALFVAIGTVCLTSPWWLTVLLRFGLDPYLSAMQTGLHGLNYLIALFVPFSGEPFLTIIALLAVLGVALQVAQGSYLIPIWYVLPFLLEPRSAANVAMVPMALLSSLALTRLILPTLSNVEGHLRSSGFDRPLQSRSEKFLLYYLLGCLLIAMQYYCTSFSENRISTTTRTSFDWIRSNAPAESKFLILTGKTDLFADFTNEWFPVLTQRVSQTTIQGYEWIGGGVFNRRVPVLQALQRCPGSTSALMCIETAATEGFEYDYIFVARKNGNTIFGAGLIAELNDSEQYESVYEGIDETIFKLLK